MNQIALFEKVSFEQYQKDCEAAYGPLRGTAEELRKEWEAIRLPERATANSAGYDFFLPRHHYVTGLPVTFPTGIRCRIKEDWFLLCCPKSGLGFKHGLRLCNTIGIVDSDYYGAQNEGHIHAKIYSDTPFVLEAGDKFMQGIFLPFGITENDSAAGKRMGGFGSTGA